MTKVIKYIGWMLFYLAWSLVVIGGGVGLVILPFWVCYWLFGSPVYLVPVVVIGAILLGLWYMAHEKMKENNATQINDLAGLSQNERCRRYWDSPERQRETARALSQLSLVQVRHDREPDGQPDRPTGQGYHPR